MNTPEEVYQAMGFLLTLTTVSETKADNAVANVGIDQALEFLVERGAKVRAVDDKIRQLVRQSHKRTAISPTQVGIALQLEGGFLDNRSGYRFNLDDLLLYQVETIRGDDIGMVRICRRSTLK